MIYKMLPKIGKYEVLCFHSVADVLAFDKKYEWNFNYIGERVVNWEFIVNNNWENIMKTVWAYIEHGKIRWIMIGDRIIKYWKPLAYDL